MNSTINWKRFLHTHTHTIWSRITNAKYKTKMRPAPRGIYWETPTLAHLSEHKCIIIVTPLTTVARTGQCGVAETRRLIILTGCLLGNGILFSGTVNQLSAPFVVKISHFSSTLWCGSSVVVFVIYSIVVCVQDNKGHHVKHSPHTDDTRKDAAAAAAAAAASSGNSSSRIGGVSRSVAVPQLMRCAHGGQDEFTLRAGVSGRQKVSETYE